MRNGSYQLSAISRQPGEDGSYQLSAISRQPNKLKAESRKLTAFTLTEMLTVLVIMTILVGIVVGAAKYAHTKAARSRAEAEIAAMEAGLESYKSDNGIYPRTTSARGSLNNSGSLVTFLVGGPKKYYSFKVAETQDVSGVVCFIDPFGRPYNYYCTSPPAGDQENKATFDLWSSGPDGLSGTVAEQADDITNWKQ